MNLKQVIKITNKVLVQNQPMQLPAVVVDRECICGDLGSPFMLEFHFEKALGESQKQMSKKKNLQPLVLYQNEYFP